MLKLKPLLLSAFIAIPSLCLSEDQPFNGLLLDASGMPIKNAKIYVTSPDRYAKTDKKGKFGLTNVQSTDTLKIKIKKRKSPYLIPVEGSKGLKIYLADQGTYQISPDEEMASIGYGWVKRREYTGSSAGISGDDLRRTGKHDILSALQGKVAGMNITGSGTPWSENQVTIRGQKSIYLFVNSPICGRRNRSRQFRRSEHLRRGPRRNPERGSNIRFQRGKRSDIGVHKRISEEISRSLQCRSSDSIICLSDWKSLPLHRIYRIKIVFNELQLIERQARYHIRSA